MVLGLGLLTRSSTVFGVQYNSIGFRNPVCSFLPCVLFEYRFVRQVRHRESIKYRGRGVNENASLLAAETGSHLFSTPMCSNEDFGDPEYVQCPNTGGLSVGSTSIAPLSSLGSSNLIHLCNSLLEFFVLTLLVTMSLVLKGMY